MAELKPVPSGYDSSALSSMMSYLANARRSHDNNPGMRMLLDREMRDNKQEYLADADLTRNAQSDDNEYAKRLNMAQLLQKEASERASRAVTMNTTSDGSLITDPLAQDQGLASQSDQDMGAALQAMLEGKTLEPVTARSVIRKNNADTENTLISAVEGRANVGDLRPIDNIHDLPDDVNIDPENSLRVHSSAATGRDAVVRTNTQEEGNEGTNPFMLERDAEGKMVERPLRPSEVTALRGTPEADNIVYRRNRTSAIDQTRTTSNGKGTSTPSLRDPSKSIEDAISLAKEKGLDVKGSGQDSNGAYVIVNNQRLYPRPKQQQQ